MHPPFKTNAHTPPPVRKELLKLIIQLWGKKIFNLILLFKHPITCWLMKPWWGLYVISDGLVSNHIHLILKMMMHCTPLRASLNFLEVIYIYIFTCNSTSTDTVIQSFNNTIVQLGFHLPQVYHIKYCTYFLFNA